MWPVGAPRDDYAPSRVAYRANRLWLSPLVRVLCLWLLPLSLITLGVLWWLEQPQTQAQIRHLQNTVATQLRAQEDFLVKHMAVSGASAELEYEIRRRLGLSFPISVLDLDLDAIRAEIEALDAVARADVHVMLGGGLVLGVTERAPVVVWRHSGGLDLLDLDGHRVAVTDRRDGAADLPLITAQGADRAVAEALELHQGAVPIADRVRGLTRQGERRWDLILTGNRVVQLPEEGAVAALRRVIALHEAGELLDRDISVIDMRNPERPTVRLGGQAFGYLRTLRAFEQGLAQ